MRNFTKILCVALALVVALSAASCSLTKQYSYKTDDVELPIGVYIYYLQSAYSEAKTLAGESDKYDSEAGTYDGEKSFLKMEITDEDGVTAVAEQWILDKADEYMNEACAVYYEYNKLGATLDEATHSSYADYYKSYWDQGLSETYEGYGIGLDSFILAGITIPLMKSAVFEAEYSAGGPNEVPDDELKSFFEENYTSYKYFSADLFTSTTDEAGEESNVAMTEDEIKAYEEAFKAYADKVNDGKTVSEMLDEYNEAFSASATVTEDIQKIDEDTEDEIMLAIAGLKEGEAQYKTIGEGDSAKMYLLYKAPIADEKDYLDDSDHKLSVISEMKTDDFDELLKTIASTITITKSSSCSSYKPSMFED